MDKILEKLIITLKSSQTEFNNPSFLLPVVNITVAKYQAKCTGLNSNIPNTKLIGFYTASLALRFTDEWPKVKQDETTDYHNDAKSFMRQHNT